MVRAETWDSWKSTGASDRKGPMRAQEKRSKKTSSQTTRKAGPEKKKNNNEGKPMGILEAGVVRASQ